MKMELKNFYALLLLHLLTLFSTGLLGAAPLLTDWEGKTLLKICHTYPTMMKLGTVIPYLKKV